MSGKVVHFEIPVDDVDRAHSFYRNVFGWELTSMPGMGYTMVRTVATDEQGAPAEAGAINGGMLLRQAPISQPVITVEVDDMDRALVEVAELGGAVVRGSEPVGDMGFAAYITDTEGNVVGLWQTRN